MKGSLPQSAARTAPSSEGGLAGDEGISPSVRCADSPLVRGGL